MVGEFWMTLRFCEAEAGSISTLKLELSLLENQSLIDNAYLNSEICPPSSSRLI